MHSDGTCRPHEVELKAKRVCSTQKKQAYMRSLEIRGLEDVQISKYKPFLKDAEMGERVGLEIQKLCSREASSKL